MSSVLEFLLLKRRFESMAQTCLICISKRIPSIIHRHQSVAARIDFVERISTLRNDPASPARSFPDKSWADGVVHDIIKNLLKVTTKGSAVPNAADGNAIVSAIFKLDETWPAKLEL
jgi:hypothetical protein